MLVCYKLILADTFAYFQDLVSVVVDGEAEGSVTSFQTETLFLQMPSSSLVQADLNVLVTALKSVYEDAGEVFHLLMKLNKWHSHYSHIYLSVTVPCFTGLSDVTCTIAGKPFEAISQSG